MTEQAVPTSPQTEAAARELSSEPVVPFGDPPVAAPRAVFQVCPNSKITALAGDVWVSCARDGLVTRHDAATGRVKAEIQIEPAPSRGITDLVGIDGGAGAVWVAESDAERVLKIDPAVNEVVASIAVPFAPTSVVAGEAVVLVPAQEGIEGQDEAVFRIDPDGERVVGRLPEKGMVVEGVPGSVLEDDGALIVLAEDRAVRYRAVSGPGEVLEAVAQPDAIVDGHAYTISRDPATENRTLGCAEVLSGASCGVLDLQQEIWTQAEPAGRHLWVFGEGVALKVRQQPLQVVSVVEVGPLIPGQDTVAVADDTVAWANGVGQVAVLE